RELEDLVRAGVKRLEVDVQEPSRDGRAMASAKHAHHIEGEHAARDARNGWQRRPRRGGLRGPLPVRVQGLVVAGMVGVGLGAQLEACEAGRLTRDYEGSENGAVAVDPGGDP